MLSACITNREIKLSPHKQTITMCYHIRFLFVIAPINSDAVYVSFSAILCVRPSKVVFAYIVRVYICFVMCTCVVRFVAALTILYLLKRAAI